MPILDQHELQSSVWINLREHLEQRLAERRAYNDGETLTEKETAVVRGEIKEIKRLLREGHPDTRRTS